MPFLFVLLANYRSLQTEPVERGWGEVREAQLEALKLPHTAVASAIDVGDAGDIHPRDKQTVGRRLALAARALVYHESVEYSGPACAAANREENRLRLLFDHTGSGLTTRDGEPVKGFAVRGSADGPWLWAEAEIQGNTVLVWNRDLADINEVRYAWADNPVGNLSNIEGLPALPFRLDI